MAHLIDKSALMAEIKRLENDEFLCDSYDEATGFQSALRMVQEFIDTLEVKEVDDEKCKEYDKALSIAKAWYQASDSSSQERNVARMIMGEKVREPIK